MFFNTVDFPWHIVLDYADNRFLFQKDGEDYLSCSFDVEYPVVNKLRVSKVDLGEMKIWIRKEKSKDEDDTAHMITPEFKEGEGFVKRMLSLGDDEVVEGNFVYFPISSDKITLRFYSRDKSKSVLLKFGGL